jgi:hypothetical protein
MANNNARVIIPLAVSAWVGSLVLTQPGVPSVAQVAGIVAFACAVPVAVFYLMSEMGWSALARRFRATRKFRGRWIACPSGQMAHVSVHDPEFERNRLRLVGGTLRVAAGDTALHLSMLFSRVPILGRFFPDVEIPWAAVTNVTAFEAPGWFRPASEPGALLQTGYDPNYTGTFVELEVGTPPVFIQLPEAALGSGRSHLGLASGAP